MDKWPNISRETLQFANVFTRESVYACVLYTHPSHPHTLTPSPSQLLELKDVVSVRRCRLVRYDDYTECLDQSFDDSEVSEGVRVCGKCS